MAISGQMRSVDPAGLRWTLLGPAARTSTSISFLCSWCWLRSGRRLVSSSDLLDRIALGRACPGHGGILNGELLRHASYTAGEAAAGFIIGAVPAVVLPFPLRRKPILTAILDPFMVGGYGAPKLALAPLFILWFGIGIWSKIVLVAVTVFFIVYFSTLAGIRALDPKLVQMAQVAGASERDVARYIVFPGAVPHIFSGLRIAMPYSIGGAVIAELISANRGLGYLVQLGAMNFDTTSVFAALAVVTLIVFLGNWCVNAAERRLLRWRRVSDVKIQVGT